MRFLPHDAALFSLQLLLAAVTDGAYLPLAALFSLLGVQVLGSSLLARRTAAVAATGPRGQLAAVLIRLTSDTGLSLRGVDQPA